MNKVQQPATRSARPVQHTSSRTATNHRIDKFLASDHPVVDKTATQLAEIAQANLYNRALSVLGGERYSDCDMEELTVQIFGCVSNDLMSEDVADWAAESLEEYMTAMKAIKKKRHRSTSQHPLAKKRARLGD